MIDLLIWNSGMSKAQVLIMGEQISSVIKLVCDAKLNVH